MLPDLKKTRIRLIYNDLIWIQSLAWFYFYFFSFLQTFFCALSSAGAPRLLNREAYIEYEMSPYIQLPVRELQKNLNWYVVVVGGNYFYGNNNKSGYEAETL